MQNKITDAEIQQQPAPVPSAQSPLLLDPRSRRAMLSGRTLALGGRAFDLLAALAAEPGAVVSAGSLIDAVWPRQAVADNNLRVQIAQLRRQLGRDAILNVPGRGYALSTAWLERAEPTLTRQARPAQIGHPCTCAKAQGATIGAGDLRAAHRLLGECLELWADPAAWQDHLLAGVSNMIRLPVGLHAQVIDFGPGMQPQLLGGHEHGWPEPAQRLHFANGVQAGLFSSSPLDIGFRAAAQRGRHVVLARADLLPDRQWQRSEFNQRVNRPAGMDEMIYSAVRIGPRQRCDLLVFGGCGHSPRPRDRALLGLVHRELVLVRASHRPGRRIDARTRAVGAGAVAGRVERGVRRRDRASAATDAAPPSTRPAPALRALRGRRPLRSDGLLRAASRQAAWRLKGLRRLARFSAGGAAPLDDPIPRSGRSTTMAALQSDRSTSVEHSLRDDGAGVEPPLRWIREPSAAQTAGTDTKAWLQLSAREQCLYRGGRRIVLTPRAFALLMHLVERPYELASTRDLLRSAWPGAVVEAGQVKQFVHLLRTLLGDDPAAPHFIETVRGRGYRYLGGIALLADGPPAAGRAVAAPEAASRADRSMALAALGEGQRVLCIVEPDPADADGWLAQQLAVPMLASWTLHARCAEVCRDEPYSPLLDALDALCAAVDDSFVIAAMQRFAPTWALQLPWRFSSAEIDAMRPLGAADVEGRWRREFARLVESLAAHRPLMLRLDDLHQADATSRRLLDYLLMQPMPARLCVLVTTRSEEQADELQRVATRFSIYRVLRPGLSGAQGVATTVAISINASHQSVRKNRLE